MTSKKSIPDPSLFGIKIQPALDIVDGRHWMAPEHPKISFHRLASCINAAHREAEEHFALGETEEAQKKSAVAGELLFIAAENLKGAELVKYLAQYTNLTADDCKRYENAFRAKLINATPKTGKQDFYAMLAAIAAAKHYKPGWIFHKYRERFGESPPDAFKALEPLEPTAEVNRFIRLAEIQHAKSIKNA